MIPVVVSQCTTETFVISLSFFSSSSISERFGVVFSGYSSVMVFILSTDAILASLFLVTCLGLAVLSARKEKSLMDERVTTEQPVVPESAAKVEVDPEAAAPVTDSKQAVPAAVPTENK